MASILAISAHPDDETLFAGGTLAMYAGQGHDVTILETTRGEGGEIGEPPLTSRENLGTFREHEVRKAAQALGVRDIFFLPYIDPYMEINGIARRIDVPLEDFAKAIGEYVDRIQPDLVITHGSNGEYGHPQHIYTHRAARLALANGHADTALMSWSAWYEPSERERILNNDDRADIVNDITPWLDAKITAALFHKTQHAMFLRNSGAPSIADMVWKTESFHIWKGPLPTDLTNSTQSNTPPKMDGLKFPQSENL
ncbi:MAG: PIG-L family deacetylase [Desulfobacterales bacterium]|nr:MAG: PIG-L family deacetylase [Desulfobacterales bacterium]